MKQRLKIILFTVIPTILVLIAVIIVKSKNRPEPLSPSEILAKSTWNKDELAFALARNFKHQADKDGRQEILKHLQEQLRKLPPAEQDNIKHQAFVQAIDDTIKQFRAMPPDMQVKMIDSMKKRADRTHKQVTGMNRDQKEKLRSDMNSKLGQTAHSEMNKAFFNKLTPDERKAFDPIQRQWVMTIEEL